MREIREMRERRERKREREREREREDNKLDKRDIKMKLKITKLLFYTLLSFNSWSLLTLTSRSTICFKILTYTIKFTYRKLLWNCFE